MHNKRTMIFSARNSMHSEKIRLAETYPNLNGPACCVTLQIWCCLYHIWYL